MCCASEACTVGGRAPNKAGCVPIQIFPEVIQAGFQAPASWPGVFGSATRAEVRRRPGPGCMALRPQCGCLGCYCERCALCGGVYGRAAPADAHAHVPKGRRHLRCSQRVRVGHTMMHARARASPSFNTRLRCYSDTSSCSGTSSCRAPRHAQTHRGEDGAPIGQMNRVGQNGTQMESMKTSTAGARRTANSQGGGPGVLCTNRPNFLSRPKQYSNRENGNIHCGG